ncbi:MAG TPA: hypothetical protein VJP89_05550 [Pyrinomonadaceae bacterium]|nr:hypothetical protein [Pyrinomonadaceae bacterium]
MKRCPTCNRSYADNTLSFCLEDGARLEPAYDPEATVVAQPRPPTLPVVKPRGPKSSRLYLIIILWLLVILVGGGIGLYVTLNKYNERNEVVASPSPEPLRGDPVLHISNQNTQTKASPSPTVSATPTPSDQPAIPKIYDKSYDVARKLLIREGWLPNKRLPIHGEDADVQSGNGPIFWQRGYWELEACSGTGSANCLFEFIDPTGRLLEVVTEGEEDEAGTYHATVSRVYLKKK